MTSVVTAVCVVHQVKPDAGQVGRTAIDKRPVDGPVEVGPDGLAGDTQCDTKHHGGAPQAVYAYAEEDAERWAGELDRAVPAGWFGENLRVAGIAASDAVLGERWRIGSGLELQVTGPRVPCATFARHVDQRRWVKRFADRGDVGCYLRVTAPGRVLAGDPIVRRDIPDHGVTVRDFLAVHYGWPVDGARLRGMLDGHDGLTALQRRLVHTAIDRNGG